MTDDATKISLLPAMLPLMGPELIVGVQANGGVSQTGTTTADQVAALALKGDAAARGVGVFQTRAAAVAAVISASLMVITTMAYAASGDGGGATYKRVSSPPAGAEYFTSADGAKWQITETVYAPEQFAAKRDLSAECSASLQRMFDHFDVEGGGKAQFTQYYKLDNPVTIKSAASIEGVGAYDYGADGGTLIRTSHPTNDLFLVRTASPVHWANLTIDSTVVRTAGAFIDLAGDGTDSYNIGSTFRGVRMYRAWNGLRIRSAIDWNFHAGTVFDFYNVGIYLSGEGWTGSNGDDTTGHSSVSSSTIWAFATFATAQACIRYECGGDFRVIGSKILGGQYGFRLVLMRGPTGTLLLQSNSFEQQTVKQFSAEQGVANMLFGNIVCNDNQWSIIADANYTAAGADPQATFSISAGTSAVSYRWIRNVTFCDNVFNHSYAPSTTRASVAINDGEVVVCDGNAINFNGVGANNYGFGIGANAKKVSLGRMNRVDGLSGGKKYLSLTTECLVDDRSGMLFADRPTVANGSEIYFTDGTPGSSPLAGNGTGAIGARLNGAWVG